MFSKKKIWLVQGSVQLQQGLACSWAGADNYGLLALDFIILVRQILIFLEEKDTY